jgi:tetratricopeptide (TPR) repeat protein
MNLQLMPKAFCFASLLFFNSFNMALAANYYQEGKEMYEAKHFERAKECFEAEIKNRPENAAAHYLLANVYLELGQREQAQQEYKKSVQLDPTSPAGRYSRIALASISSNWQSHKVNDEQSASESSASSPSGDTSATIKSSKVISKEVTHLVERQQAECNAKVQELLTESENQIARLTIEMQEHIAANGQAQYVQAYVPQWGGGARVHLVKTYDPEPDNQVIREEYGKRIEQVRQKARHDADQLVDSYKQKQLALEDAAINIDKSYVDKNPNGNIIVSPTGTDIYNRNYQTGDSPSGNPVPVMLPPAKLLPGIQASNKAAQ